MDIGDRIRAARKAAGISQEEVARRAGLSLKGMGDIERGDIEDPHFSSLAKIAHALGVPVGTLVGEEEPAVPLAEASEARPASPIDSQQWERVLANVRERQSEVEARVEELVELDRGEVKPSQVLWVLEEAKDCVTAIALAMPGSRREQNKVIVEISPLFPDLVRWEEYQNALRFYNDVVARLVEAGLVELRERAGQRAEPVPVRIGA